MDMKKKLHFSLKIKDKVAVHFTKLCNNFETLKLKIYQNTSEEIKSTSKKMFIVNEEKKKKIEDISNPSIDNPLISSEIISSESPAKNVDHPYETINTIDVTEVNILQDNIADVDNYQDVKAQPAENIIEYLLQHAKQHCPKCFIHHTPHPKWCNTISTLVQKQKIQKSQQSTIQQCNKLLGGGRTKIVKPPKIRILAPENKEMYILGSIFRSFKNYWNIYDYHMKCEIINNRVCKFCSIRSLSQRLNERKREPYIQPHEIVENVEKATSAQILMSTFITQMSASFKDFSFNESLNMVCQGCGRTHKSGQDSLIFIDLSKENGDLLTCMSNEITKIQETAICCEHEDKELKIHKNQNFLFILLRPSYKLEIQHKYNIHNEEFLYLSHVQEIKEKEKTTYKTHFNHNGLILNQNGYEIL